MILVPNTRNQINTITSFLPPSLPPFFFHRYHSNNYCCFIFYYCFCYKFLHLPLSSLSLHRTQSFTIIACDHHYIRFYLIYLTLSKSRYHPYLILFYSDSLLFEFSFISILFYLNSLCFVSSRLNWFVSCIQSIFISFQLSWQSILLRKHFILLSTLHLSPFPSCLSFLLSSLTRCKIILIFSSHLISSYFIPSFLCVFVHLSLDLIARSVPWSPFCFVHLVDSFLLSFFLNHWCSSTSSPSPSPSCPLFSLSPSLLWRDN